jgi:hypothetical protein
MIQDEIQDVIKLSTPGSPEYIPPLTPSIFATPYPGMPPSPGQSPSSMYLRTPAIVQSSAKLNGGGGEIQIFPPQHPDSVLFCKTDCISTTSRRMIISATCELSLPSSKVCDTARYVSILVSEI